MTRINRKVACRHDLDRGLVGGVAGVLTTLRDMSTGPTVVQSGGSISARSTYWIIALIFGRIMLMSHMRFERHRNGPGPERPGSGGGAGIDQSE